MNEGFWRVGLVGEDVFVAARGGRGIVDEEGDLVPGVVMLPSPREA